MYNSNYPWEVGSIYVYHNVYDTYFSPRHSGGLGTSRPAGLDLLKLRNNIIIVDGYVYQFYWNGTLDLDYNALATRSTSNQFAYWSAYAPKFIIPTIEQLRSQTGMEIHGIVFNASLETSIFTNPTSYDYLLKSNAPKEFIGTAEYLPGINSPGSNIGLLPKSYILQPTNQTNDNIGGNSISDEDSITNSVSFLNPFQTTFIIVFFYLFH